MSATAREITEYCLSKKEAYVDYPFGDIPLCFRVRKKIFAELYPSLENYKITLKCDPVLADFYRQEYPEIVVRGYHCPPVQQPYRNTIWIAGIDSELLYDMIDHSYAQVIQTLPKKQQKEFVSEIDESTVD